MGRPRGDADAVQTRERLLVAAEAAFAGHGFEATRLEDVALAAGIRRPSLLYHFGSKDALYAAVIERAFARLGTVLAEAMTTGGDFAERLAATSVRFHRFLDDDPSFAPLVLREILDGRGPGRDLLVAGVAPTLDAVTAWIEQEGRGVARADLSVREVILQIAMAGVVRAAADPALRVALWGGDEASDVAVRLLVAPGAGSRR